MTEPVRHVSAPDFLRTRRRGVPLRTPRVASAVVLATFVLAGCGVQAHTVEVPVTRPTLFPPNYTTAPTTSAAPGGSTMASSTSTTKVPRPIPAVLADGKPRAVVTSTGVVAAVDSVRADGAFVVTSPCGAAVAVSKATPIVAANVVLDPGHGGALDPGTVGPTGTKEAAVNLAVAQAAAAQLEAFGVKVVLTRTADYYSTLASRARVATSLAPNAFVSIHHNGAPDHVEDRPGTEVYYQADDERSSKRLAGLIYEEVTIALAPQKIRWGWYADAGVKARLNDQGRDYYGILRNAAGVPSALAELSFLTDVAEEALLKTPEFQKLEGAAVARGILRYLTTDDPGSGFVGASKRTDATTGGGSTICVDPPLQ